MDFSSLVATFLALSGYASLVALIINTLKAVGVVKDGDAQVWSTAFNLVGLVLLFVLWQFVPTFNVAGADKFLATAVSVAGPIIAFLLQLLVSKLAHIAVRGVPVIGASHSA